LIEARNNAISIKNFSLSVLEKFRIDAADIWDAIQTVFRWSIGTGRKLAEILNGENLAIFELCASNNVDRPWGIDDAHVLPEHGVNRTCSRNNLIFGGTAVTVIWFSSPGSLPVDGEGEAVWALSGAHSEPRHRIMARWLNIFGESPWFPEKAA